MEDMYVDRLLIGVQWVIDTRYLGTVVDQAAAHRTTKPDVTGVSGVWTLVTGHRTG